MAAHVELLRVVKTQPYNKYVDVKPEQAKRG